jgi:hypothetical protein
MNKPIMPAEIRPIYQAYMIQSLEQRLRQIQEIVSRVEHADFANPEEAHDVMRQGCWYLEWVGYAMEFEVEVIVEMVDLQRFLVRWSKRWVQLEENPNQQLEVQNIAREWSSRAFEWANFTNSSEKM